jgi:cation diffusion facilitator CzcD-associated flavoprotein CzcO
MIYMAECGGERQQGVFLLGGNQRWLLLKSAYVCWVVVAGFPNLFLIKGPNTGLGHNSMIYMAECGGERQQGVFLLGGNQRWLLLKCAYVLGWSWLAFLTCS